MRFPYPWLLALVLSACGSAETASSSRPERSSGGESAAGSGEGQSQVDLAMVMLAEPTPLAFQSFEAALSGFGGERIAKPGEKDGVVTFEIGQGIGAIALMPAPIPWSDIEPVAESAFMWPEAASVLRGHRAHVIVSLLGQGGSLRERKLRLTRVVAAVAEATNALGIYWGDAPTVHARPLFVDGAREASLDDPPLQLWLGLSMARPGAGRISLLTFGMDKLGLQNLLVEASAEDGNAALGFVFDAAKYVVLGTRPIRDGDTIGHDESQRIPVRYRPSPVDATATVLAIELPNGFGRQ